MPRWASTRSCCLIAQVCGNRFQEAAVSVYFPALPLGFEHYRAEYFDLLSVVWRPATPGHRRNNVEIDLPLPRKEQIGTRKDPPHEPSTETDARHRDGRHDRRQIDSDVTTALTPPTPPRAAGPDPRPRASGPPRAAHAHRRRRCRAVRRGLDPGRRRQAAVTAAQGTVARLAVLGQQVSPPQPEVDATGWVLHGRVYNDAIAAGLGLLRVPGRRAKHLSERLRLRLHRCHRLLRAQRPRFHRAGERSDAAGASCRGGASASAAAIRPDRQRKRAADLSFICRVRADHSARRPFRTSRCRPARNRSAIRRGRSARPRFRPPRRVRDGRGCGARLKDRPEAETKPRHNEGEPARAGPRHRRQSP